MIDNTHPPPAYDVSLTVAEVHWCYEQGLRGGIQIPPLEAELPGYHDRYYDPLWEIAQALELPVMIHGGSSGSAPDGATTFGSE